MSSTLTPWLTRLVHSQSNGKVEFQKSPVGGLGGVALVDFVPGDVIFEVPAEWILSSRSARVQNDPEVQKLLSSSLDITLETALFVYVARRLHLANTSNDINANTSNNNNTNNQQDDEYLRSLPTKPSLLVATELTGTNLASQLLKDSQEIKSQLEKIHSLGGHQWLTLDMLTLAKYNYNSRRYPVAFDGLGGLEESSRSATASTSTNARRQYDMTQGCLCTLLDILNHKASDTGSPRLVFDTSDTVLKVMTSVKIAQGEEIFSDYGCTSNNQCLLQFHFCDQTLPGVYTVIVGGQRFDLMGAAGLPSELMIDGGYGLHCHLSQKEQEMTKVAPSCNYQVVWYMNSQKDLLRELIMQCEALMVDHDSDNDDQVVTSGGDIEDDDDDNDSKCFREGNPNDSTNHCKRTKIE